MESGDPSLLAFVGSSRVQSWGDSRNFRSELPAWNSESAAQLSHRKADRLAQQEPQDPDSRLISLLDVIPEPAIATSSTELFDTHPGLLDELEDFQLDETFKGLLIS